jgi:propanol-preferring alcohol dehydrogenase
MRAFRLIEYGRPPEFVDLPKPAAGPGEVLVQMRGAGLCRSDLDLMDARPGEPPFASHIPAGYTLGHENAGIVVELGAGVTDLREGDAVAVYLMQTCGSCDYCSRGFDHNCQTYVRGALSEARGIGIDGGLAEYLRVRRREVIPIGSLDPVLTAPLTDAGVTSYRAVTSALPHLHPGATAVVFGIGGLGSFAIQFLRILSGARIIAVDTTAERLSRARELGADACVVWSERVSEEIMDLTCGKGADAAIDIVGSEQTLSAAARISRPQGRIVLVGLDGGSMPFGWGRLASTCIVTTSMGGTRADLSDVVALAEAGRLKIDVDKFAFEDVEEAYLRLRNGKLNGRAVVVFDDPT